MPGSASTWVFNVAREVLLRQAGARVVESFYSDALDRAWPVFREQGHLDRIVVWKLHEPDADWPAFLREARVKLVLSIRDPRDAMLSLMERFGETGEAAFARVNVAFTRVLESLAYPHIGLRYEDRFFEQPDTVAQVARYLGVPIDGADGERIFATYRTARVNAFAGDLDALPGDRRRGQGSAQYDEVTQIHRRHIGDQRVGKWRDQFNAEERRRLTGRFRPFLDMFGYDRD